MEAPDADRISPEIARILVELYPDYVLGVVNTILKSGQYSKIWKQARLVLVKPEDGRCWEVEMCAYADDCCYYQNRKKDNRNRKWCLSKIGDRI